MLRMRRPGAETKPPLCCISLGHLSTVVATNRTHLLDSEASICLALTCSLLSLGGACVCALCEVDADELQENTKVKGRKDALVLDYASSKMLDSQFCSPSKTEQC